MTEAGTNRNVCLRNLFADKYISTGDMDYGKNQNKICTEHDRPDAGR